MLTISLDEQGDFENNQSGLMFIAGLIFDDCDNEGELTLERKRIASYYKNAIAKAGEDFSYPEDLHSNGDKERDGKVI